MEMIIDFPGGSRVDAHFGPYTVATDQPPVGSAPTPFAVFLASVFASNATSPPKASALFNESIPAQ